MPNSSSCLEIHVKYPALINKLSTLKKKIKHHINILTRIKKKKKPQHNKNST